MQNPCITSNLIVICGLSFAGKTTLGDAISHAFGHPQVDVDEIKYRIYGADIRDGDLDGDQWNRIYREADNTILELLIAGNSVVDASRNFREAERDNARRLASKCSSGVLVVYVDTPEKVCRERWDANRRTPTRRDLSRDDFEDIISVMEPPKPDEDALVFHYTNDIKRWLTEHDEHLKGRRRLDAHQRG